MTFPVTVADLQASYHEATKNNGIIDLLQKLRGQNVIIKVDELASCFNSPQWNVRYVGGHRILTHRVTKVVIGYQAHDGQDVKMEIKKTNFRKRPKTYGHPVRSHIQVFHL